MMSDTNDTDDSITRKDGVRLPQDKRNVESSAKGKGGSDDA